MEVRAKRRGGGKSGREDRCPNANPGSRARQSPHEKHSRALSRILRHSAAEEGIPIDTAGFVDVDVLLARPQFRGLGLAGIQTIVSSCSKQRFGLEQRDGGSWYIRANQGHTMALVAAEELLTPVSSADVARYPVVVHGTNPRAWAAIRTAGLNRMARQHVHFATGHPGDDGVVSGMRSGAQVLIYLDLARAVSAAIPFFVSANGVLLSPGLGDTGAIPPAFFADAVNTCTGKALLGLPATHAPPGPSNGGNPVPVASIDPTPSKAQQGPARPSKAQRKNSKRRLNKLNTQLAKLHTAAHAGTNVATPPATPHQRADQPRPGSALAQPSAQPSASVTAATSSPPTPRAGPGASQLRIIEGDLLAAEDQYLVHQTNCVSKAAQGLALSIFQRHPHADVYARRRAAGREDTPGTIDVRGGDSGVRTSRRGVIGLFGQHAPGRPRGNAGFDSRAARLEWFAQGLAAIAKTPGLKVRQLRHYFGLGLARISQLNATPHTGASTSRQCLPAVDWCLQCDFMANARLKSLAFPTQIGCGLAGGHWPSFLTALEAFAAEVAPAGVTVTLYRLPGAVFDRKSKVYTQHVTPCQPSTHACMSPSRNGLQG